MAASRSIGVSEPVTRVEEGIVEEVADAIVEVIIGHAIMSLSAYALTISTYDIRSNYNPLFFFFHEA